jgi:hypothetical protein
VARALVYGKDYTIWADNLDRELLTRAREDHRITCYCGKALTFVSSTLRISHFRHFQGNCSIVGAERDTITHNEALEYIGHFLRNNLKRAIIEKEKTFALPEGLRRTDLYAQLANGKGICYEVQCSRCSTSEYEDRTAAYKRLGHRIVWILGPEVTGVRKPSRVSSLDEVVNGVPTTIRSIALSALLERGYLCLYFPDEKERLWLAYCPTGKFDATRKFVVKRGEQEVLVSLSEVGLSYFQVELGTDGNLYATRFPINELKVKFERPSEINEVLRKVYGRELRHRGLRTVKQAKAEREKDKGKASIKFKKSSSNYCAMCDSEILNQHYHKCVTCDAILDDRCTVMIERGLGECEHNMTGWVRHCEWLQHEKENQMAKKPT